MKVENAEELKSKIDLIAATYRYETSIDENLPEEYCIQKSFVRNLKIFYLGRKEKYQYFRIICLKFNFSDEENSDVIFLKKLSYLWDDLEILVNEENIIVKIVNLISLKMRWQEISATLSLDYKGNEVGRYFQTISLLLENDKEAIAFLNSYKMLGLLFNGQYGGYVDNIKTRLISEEGIEFSESLKLTKKENRREVKTGILNKELTHFEIYNGIFFYENSHLIEAFLDIKMQDKQIKHSLLWIG